MFVFIPSGGLVPARFPVVLVSAEGWLGEGGKLPLPVSTHRHL